MKKIDVLICVHSQDHIHDMLLQRALESLVHQTYTDFNTIVVLDECHVDTRDIVEKYVDVLDIRLFERPRKQGLARAKNYGIDRCDGDFIAYLDADDAWTPEKLEKQIEFLEDNPEYHVVATQAWDVYDPLSDNPRIEENCFRLGQYCSDEQIKARLPYENIICHTSVLINRAALLNVDKYDVSQHLLGLEDWDLWRRMASIGYRFFCIPQRLSFSSMGTSVPR